MFNLKFKCPSAENVALPKAPSLKPDEGKNIALHVSAAARNSASFISALPVHSASTFVHLMMSTGH